MSKHWVDEMNRMQFNTETIFNLIKERGSMTGVEVRDELHRRNYKWAASSSAYLSQLANRGLLSRAKENTEEGHATNRYACLFPEYHRSVKAKKFKSKPVKRQAVAPAPVVVEPPITNNSKTQAQAMVAAMNIGLAREVYLELQRIFSLEA